MKKVTISESQFNLMKEEVVADGSAEHNPYKKDGIQKEIR